MNARPTSLLPRKTPRQARSETTVAAIFEACIQVLLDGGLERLTTTRIAERAGISVGSLYQYFPHKLSLLAAVLERHLVYVVEAVEQACLGARGRSTSVMASALVDAFLAAKLSDAAAASALHAVAAEVHGLEVVTRLTLRAQLSIGEMLATASDRRFTDLATVAFIVSGALIGPMQGLLANGVSPRQVKAVQAHLEVMVASYLRQIGARRPRRAAAIP